MKVGVVIWAEGTKVVFRILDGVRVERGDLYKVADRDRVFIIRVFDFRPETLLNPVEIARLSLRRALGGELRIFDEPLRYYDTAIATVIAEIQDGRPRSPSSVPRLFSEVETLTQKELALLNLDRGDIEIGKLRMGHRTIQRPVSLPGWAVFPHHILIASITGGGKTNLGKVIAWNIMRQREDRYSMLLIDTEGEYFDGGDPRHLGLVHSKHAERRLFYVTTKVSRPTKYRYEFKYKGVVLRRLIDAYPLKINIRELLPEDFIETGEFTPPQEALLWLLWRAFRHEWLRRLLEDRVDLLYSALGRRVPKNTIAATQRKVLYMVGDPRIFTKDEDYDTITAILNAIAAAKVVLIDMPAAAEAQEKLITVVLARRIFKHYEQMRRHRPEDWERLPTVLIFVEEAHRYLGRASLHGRQERRENIFTTISKRGRKYRVGLCCVTQMPGELEEAIIRQQLTKIILPLPTRPDYMKVINYTPYLEDAEEEIRNLERGEALIVSPPAGLKFAVPVRIHRYEELVLRELDGECASVQRAKRGVICRLLEEGWEAR